MVCEIYRDGRAGDREAQVGVGWARRSFLAVAAVGLVSLLGACSSGRDLGIAEEIYTGLPSGAPPLTPSSSLVMTLPGNKLALTDYGGGCPWVPVDLRLVTETEVEVDIKDPDAEVCTAQEAIVTRVIPLDPRDVDGAALRTAVLVSLDTGNRTEVDVVHTEQDG